MIICPDDHQFLQKEGDKISWFCYLCRPADKCDIKPRKNWRYEFMSLYWGEEYAKKITNLDAFEKPKMRAFSAFDGIATGKNFNKFEKIF